MQKPTSQTTKQVVTDGIIMPHNEMLEQEVIGTLLLEENVYEQIEQYISATSFYNTNYATIFSAIQLLYNAGKPHKMLDVVSKLQADGALEKIGGAVEIFSLTRKVTSSVYIEQRAKELHDYELRRGLIVNAIKTQNMAMDDSINVSDTFECAEKSLTELRLNTNMSLVTMYQGIESVYNYLYEMSSNASKAAISTGLSSLDSILNGGFRSPDLVIIGGRPSMGKTQFSVFFAEQAARQGKHVHFVSIEMTTTQLTMRMLAKNLSYSNMRQGKLTDEEWKMLERNALDIKEIPITISDDNECRYLSNIKSTARKLARQGKLDMLIIDYLQLVRTNQKFEKRYIEVGYITGELKALAKELHIPILLLAQLSRPAKGQEAELPKMEDLRESGDIEQDADVIIFPHRPYVYDSSMCDESGRSWEGRGLLHVAKNREGERNVSAYFKHDASFKQFYDDETHGVASRF